MKQNMGIVDRFIRILLALIIAVLFATKQITGTGAIVFLFVAMFFLITSLFHFCPLYVPFGISTRKK